MNLSSFIENFKHISFGNSHGQVQKTGLSPGSVVYTGSSEIEPVKIFVTDFSIEAMERRELKSLTELSEHVVGNRWLQIKGLHDIDILHQLGKQHKIHTLALEDIANPHHPPKIEEFDDHLFVIAKMLVFDAERNQLKLEHVCFVLIKDLLISFQETNTILFEPILKRLENPTARMRKFGIDYFLYAILDLIVDNYFVAIEELNDQFERLEQEVIDNPKKSHVESIHTLKRQVVLFRKSVRPLREVVNMLMRDDVKLMSGDIDIFLRDLYDHTIQVTDSLETLRDLASGLLDTYLTQVSHRMNEVMKVLTIMSTIFIPLGFLAGLYGMNFANMPELHFKYGYFMLLGFMAVAVVSMLLLFKFKKWI